MNQAWNKYNEVYVRKLKEASFIPDRAAKQKFKNVDEAEEWAENEKTLRHLASYYTSDQGSNLKAAFRGQRTLGLEWNAGLAHKLCLLQEAVTKYLKQNNIYLQYAIDFQKASWSHLRNNQIVLPTMNTSIKSKGCTRFWVEWQNASDFVINQNQVLDQMKEFNKTDVYERYMANQKVCDIIYIHWIASMEVSYFIFLYIN